MGYLGSALALPTPTKKQTKDFAEHLVGAHSWYKHIKVDMPTRFYVYLSPNAGRDVNGNKITNPRHYSSMHTDEWISKFGHWEFFITRLEKVPPSNQLFHSETRLDDQPIVCGDNKALVPSWLCFHADVTCHVYKAKFKAPYGCTEMSIGGKIDFFSMDHEDFGWRDATRLEIVKKRLCLRKVHQAQLGFLSRLARASTQTRCAEHA